VREAFADFAVKSFEPSFRCIRSLLSGEFESFVEVFKSSGLKSDGKWHALGWDVVSTPNFSDSFIKRMSGVTSIQSIKGLADCYPVVILRLQRLQCSNKHFVLSGIFSGLKLLLKKCFDLWWEFVIWHQILLQWKRSTYKSTTGERLQSKEPEHCLVSHSAEASIESPTSPTTCDDNPEFSMSEHILILGLVPKVVAFRYSLVVELWMRVTGQTLALPASARDCLGDKLSAVSD
jgi:hypothetical protein